MGLWSPDTAAYRRPTSPPSRQLTRPGTTFIPSVEPLPPSVEPVEPTGSVDPLPPSVEPVETTASVLPRRRYVEVLSQTVSPSAVADATKSTAVPLGCGRRAEACTSICRVSPTVTGRCEVTVLAMWTVPMAGNGNCGEVITAMCSGKASTCGKVSGAVSLSGKPHTAAYARTCSRATVAVRTSCRSDGSPPVLRTPGSWLTTGIEGRAALSRVLTMSGAQHHLAADPDDVAGDGRRRRVGEPRDGLGDVHRQPALAHRVQPSSDLAGGERHGGGHLGLDEARGDGVDRDPLLH